MTDCDEFRNTTSTTVSILNDTRNPVRAYEKEPECEDDCSLCGTDKEKAANSVVGNERLDWAKIAYHLNKPRWLFDGRNVLDIVEIEKLDVRVEGIGRVGWGGL